MSALSIDNLRVRFGAVEVLKGIDMKIDKGEFIVLVGPSGCGKSTLLNVIAGLQSSSTGRIEIGGRDVTRVAPADRDIAMVFQSYALYPAMTVKSNISFGMECRAVPRAERESAVDRVAKLLQIGHLLDRRPSQLSGGQRQRVAMGARWCATRSCSYSTSLCPTSTRNFAWRCEWRSSGCTNASGRRWSM
jgi:multiple sugar transport system ATP-binding protein